jgi:ArsR family transcriptional regulator
MSMGSWSMAAQTTDFFAALSHGTRLRTLMLLAEHGELCVCELTHAIGVSQPSTCPATCRSYVS